LVWQLINELVAHDGGSLLGGYDESALYFDKMVLSKKGKNPVGVARQCRGQLSKEDNCQMEIFATLDRGHHFLLVDYRLFLSRQE
jgi:SRSO17 transposase